MSNWFIMSIIVYFQAMLSVTQGKYQEYELTMDGVMDQWARPILEPYYPEPCAPFSIHRLQVSNEVTTMRKCPTSVANILSICEMNIKVTEYGEYNIGGTYTDDELDLWFYYTTSYCPQDKCLLSLFVCFSKVGTYDIGVSYSNDVYSTSDYYPHRRRYLPFDLDWQVFTSSQPNDKFFIKSYSIPAKLEERSSYDTLCIPIKIQKAKCRLNKDLVRLIKFKHNDHTDDGISKAKKDFTLYSASGTEYQVHKLVLASHCGMLRELVKSDTVKSLTLDISDECMKLLLGFLYTGTVEAEKDISDITRVNLAIIASKFRLKNLVFLVERIPIKKKTTLIAVGSNPVSYVLRPVE